MTTSNTAQPFPGPEAFDSEDVLLALETAQALRAKGDLREAIRWIRRAADAAEQDGNDLRAVALARAAADLTTEIGASVTVPMSVTPPPPVVSAAAASPERSDAQTPAVRPPPPPKPLSRSLPPPLPPQAAQSAASAVALPPEPAASPPPPPPPPSRVTPPPPRSSSSSTPPPPPLPKPARRPDMPVLPSTGGAALSGDLAKLVSERPVLRVSIKRSARDDNLFVARRLAAGKAPPLGTREALLVLVEGDGDSFGTFATERKQ